jgi:dTDP-4-dehydrorhamnose 3,5-epimerase
MEGVTVKPLERHDDHRGFLFEAWRSDECSHRPEMAYVSVTLPGQSRGPHEHAQQTDCFIFYGNFVLQVWKDDKYETIEITTPTQVIINPGVVHAYTCVGEQPGFVVNLPDKLYAGSNKSEPVDEIRHEGSQKYHVLSAAEMEFAARYSQWMLKKAVEIQNAKPA